MTPTTRKNCILLSVLFCIFLTLQFNLHQIIFNSYNKKLLNLAYELDNFKHSILDFPNHYYLNVFWEVLYKNKTNVSLNSTIFSKNNFRLWPQSFATATEKNEHITRLLKQLIWGIEEEPFLSNENNEKTKKILLYDGYSFWSKTNWSEHQKLQETDCGLDVKFTKKCVFTEDLTKLDAVDAVVATRDWNHLKEFNVTGSVLRFYFMLESPYHSKAELLTDNDLLATYWRGSDVFVPYSLWVNYPESYLQNKSDTSQFQNKTKPVAAFISNCYPQNNRTGYIHELKKYIQVDFYGACGDLKCSHNETKCMEMVRKQYYFYIAFENSNCRDYITEKTFQNALGNDVVPVVMGAHPDDYEALCPPNSCIHIEKFESPKQLAIYLKQLISSPLSYAAFFNWKSRGKFIPSPFFCQLCSMVYYADIVKPPKRKKTFKWDKNGAMENNLCLPYGDWYWEKYNNGSLKFQKKYKI